MAPVTATLYCLLDDGKKTSYALHAAYAEQWKIAHEQFELVGDQAE